jgi:hypothetical protein
MLRINLLPSYVSQRRLTKRLAAAFVAIFVLCVLAPLAIYASMVHHLNDVAAQADSAEAGKKITDGRKAQATAAIASIKPIQDKLDFVTAVHAYNRQWVALYNTLADTSPKSSLIYTDASVSGSIMSIKAYSPSVEVVGRYLQAMFQEPDFQTVTVDKIPGYPDNIRHLYYLNGKMVFADGATGSTGGGGQQGSSQGTSRGGFPGGGRGGSISGGGYGGGQSGTSTAPAGYTLANLGPNGPTNVPAGVGPPPAELTGGATTSPQGGGGQGSGAGQAGGYSPAFLAIADRNLSPFILPEAREAIHRQFLRRVVMVSAPKGFDINVTATLKQPLTAPTLPGTAPAAVPGRGAGFGGSMGGPMGGPPSGPGGGPPASSPG